MPSRGWVALVIGLFAVGAAALGSVAIPIATAFQRSPPTELVMDGLVLGAPTLVLSGGLFLVGASAVVFALALLLGRRAR